MKTKILICILLLLGISVYFKYDKTFAQLKDEKDLLVYSYDNVVYQYDLATETSEVIAKWDSNYDYEIVDGYLTSNHGGKKYKRDNELTDDFDSYAEEYIHTILQSPYDINSKIILKSNDLTNEFKLSLVKSRKTEFEITNNRLPESALLIPLLWLDQNTILLGNGSLEDLSYHGFYKFDLSNLEAQEFTNLPSDTIYDVLRISETQYILRGDNQQSKIWDLQKKQYVGVLNFKAQYIWGWTKGTKINDFKKRLDEFNSIKRGKTKKQTFSLIKKVYAQSTQSFLYWPVPSNHSVACGIGCYSGHVGVDIGVSTAYTTPIYASAGGIVDTLVKDQPFGADRVTSPANGNFVRIKHEINGNTYYSYYLHMSDDIQVTLDSSVSAGTLIGYGANSGLTCGYETTNTGGCAGYLGAYSHLHLQVNGSCGNSSCWINPYESDLWNTNSDDSIQDPPSSSCGETSLTLQNKTVNNGETFNCSATNQIIVKPETKFYYGSNVRLFIN